MAMISGFATLIPTINNFLPPLKITNAILLPNCVPCIYHLMQFEKNQANIQALLDSDIVVNPCLYIYIELGSKIKNKLGRVYLLRGFSDSQQ